MIFSTKAVTKIQVAIIIVALIIGITGITGIIYYFSKVATPTFSPNAGTYNSAQTVALSCSTSNATIRYTLDGSEPTSTSTVYNNPISVNATTTIKAKAFKTDMTDSNTGSATYTINIPVISTPTFSPNNGTYISTQNVVLSCSTSNATIRYTLDGSEPTSTSTVYNNPISVNATTTIKAKAFKTDMTDSNTGSATYTINIPLSVDLTTAASSGLAQININGSSLEHIRININSITNNLLNITIQPGTIFKANSGGIQSMVSIYKTEILVYSNETISRSIEVACVNMYLDAPGNLNQLTISQTPTNADLMKLVTVEEFGSASFRVKQFAIWTITDNPTRNGYTQLGTFSNYSGPSDAEMQSIMTLFIKAGISTQNYQAFQ